MSSGRESSYLEPGVPYQGGKLLHNLLLFGRVCRALGMHASPLRMVEVARALHLIEISAKRDFYHVLRALLVSKASDLQLFDEAFELFWKQPARGWTRLDLRSLGEQRRHRKTQFVPSIDESDQDGEDGSNQESPLLLPTYSPSETLRQKDFAAMEARELAAARDWIARLTTRLGHRFTRRRREGAGQRPMLSRMLRQTLRHAGEVLEIPKSVKRSKPRPLVLICDVSGSMERYTRILLHFAHALSGELGGVESFVFSTRLTRITRSIRLRSVDRALQHVSSQVKDWSGGTLTGKALRTFNFKWSRRVLGRGAVVLFVTDGWDRGEPDLLAAEMARLARSCFRLIWLNPLQGGVDYEPLTRGALSILAHCDDHLSVRNLCGLEMLARHLAQLPRSPHQQLHDGRNRVLLAYNQADARHPGTSTTVG